MRLKLALVALPLALLAAFFVYFRPQFGAAPAAGSPSAVVGQSGAPAVAGAAVGSAAPAPAASTSSGAVKMDPSTPSADTTSPILKSITVVGQGEANVAPDVAYVSVGVQTREKTAKDAQDKNNQAMATAIAKVKALGIDDKDIQTSGISLYPVYDQNSTITGYQASNTITAKVDIAKAGQVIDAAVEAGANSNVSVSFGLKDSSAATAQALEAATKEARTRADAIAKGLGVTIKEVQIAVEQSSVTPIVTSLGYANAAAASDAKMAPTPVQPGQLTVTSRVQVTYTY
jgi:uncharacterized protein